MLNFFKLLPLLIFSWVAPIAFAAEGIKLYEKPDEKSAVVTTVPAGEAIIPFFSEKDWIKAANPANGEVGWISKKTWQENNIPFVRVQTFGQKSADGINSGFQIIQSSSDAKLAVPDEKQLEQLKQQMQEQQRLLQENFQQIMNQSMQNFNRFLKQLDQEEKNQTTRAFPILQPIIIVPSEQEMKNKSWLKELKQKIDQAMQNMANPTGKTNSQ